MITGTTPTYTLTLPETIDLSQASNVYVSFADKSWTELLRKSDSDLEISANEIQVFLTQAETLAFPVGVVLIQVNWTYEEGGVSKRACSEIARDYYSGNLVAEELA